MPSGGEAQHHPGAMDYRVGIGLRRDGIEPVAATKPFDEPLLPAGPSSRTADRQVLYRSAELQIVGRRPFRSRWVVVTFSSYTAERSLDRPGFGEDFLLKYGIDAVHFICRDNDWYQYEEIDEALDAVAAATAGYESRVAFGLSMGGYAAINFSDRLRADRVIAISPQYSIDPQKMPQEMRWEADSRRIRFIRDRIDRLTPGPTTYVVYDDKLALDCAHVAKIAETVAVRPIAVSHSFHPAGKLLVETGLLSGFIRELIAGDFDEPAFRRRLAANAPHTAAYQVGLAEALPAWRWGQKVKLARRAVTLAPTDPFYRHYLDLLLRDPPAYRKSAANLGRRLALRWRTK